YYCQHFLLDASKMGVPQKRELVFFICLRKDLSDPFLRQKDMFTRVPCIDMSFNFDPIKYEQLADYEGESISEYAKKAWDFRKPSDRSIADSKRHAGMKVSDMNTFYVKEHKVCNTLTSKGRHGQL